MKSKRRHDLKHDQLADALGRFWEQVVEHRLRVIGVVAALAVLAGAIATMVATSLAARGAANDLLAAAQKDTLWIENLRQEKPEEASKKVAEAVTALRRVAQVAPQTNAAARAMLRVGQLLFSDGKAEEAISAYRECKAEAAAWPGLQQLAQQGMAVALEQAGRHAEALAAYRAMAETPSRLVKAQAFWDMGRCEEALGRRAEALAAYRGAAEAARGSRWGELAVERARVLTQEAAGPPEGLTPKPADAKSVPKVKAPGKPMADVVAKEDAKASGAVVLKVKPPERKVEAKKAVPARPAVEAKEEARDAKPAPKPAAAGSRGEQASPK